MTFISEKEFNENREIYTLKYPDRVLLSDALMDMILEKYDKRDRERLKEAEMKIRQLEEES